VALLAAAAVAAAARPAAAVTGEPACRTNEVRQHNEAVFGHFSTLAAAKKLRAKAAALGFAGIKIENDGCGDFEVEIDGADSLADRQSFATEARKAGFPVTFEQTAPPMEYRQGQVVGILATKRTLVEANALMRRLIALRLALHRHRENADPLARRHAAGAGEARSVDRARGRDRRLAHPVPPRRQTLRLGSKPGSPPNATPASAGAA
jgi:hypothetical protein